MSQQPIQANMYPSLLLGPNSAPPGVALATLTKSVNPAPSAPPQTPAVSDVALLNRMRQIVGNGDLHVLTLGTVMKQLETEFKMNLADRKEFLNDEVTKFVQSLEDINASIAEPDAPLQARIHQLQYNAQWQRGAVPAFKGVRAPLKKGRSNLKGPAKGGLTKPAKISKQLADFLGMDWNPETRLARTDVVKVLCDYVKKNNLQDPADGRKINCDDKLQTLLGEKQVTFFTINKFISQHFEKSDKPKKIPGSALLSDAGGKGFSAPLKVSDALQAVVGAKFMSRPAVVRAVWDYIKLKRLQDPHDGRSIICDDHLSKVMGESKVNMMKMNAAISKHLSRVESGSAEEQEALKALEAEKQANQRRLLSAELPPSP